MMTRFYKRFIVTLIILTIQIFLTIVILSNSAVAQNNSSPKKSEPTKTEPVKSEPVKPELKVQRIGGIKARFIVALIADGEGGAWIGTEDEGVFHYNTNGKITQYTTKNGLGDNNGYALAIDKLGRLWVGHLNTGVSVFNGKDWKNYDVVDGPIGERIFDIKICPKDDDVWLATSAGLSRYKIDANKWEHLTREDGLLEDQASTLAFKSDGTLIVGTQCHGLAIFNRNEKGEYKHAQNIVAPERFGVDNCSPVPLTPRGQGLPSNQINDIIVTKNTASKSIFIATSAGLVRASNDFSKLEYTRGKDYADKVRGLYGGAPKDFKQPAAAILDQLMPNDHLTTVVEDWVGQIWVGTWSSGILVFDTILAKRGSATQKSSGLPDNFVTKILPLKDSNFLVGTYGGGIAKSTQPFNMSGRKPATEIFAANEYSVLKKDFRHLPVSAKPPTIDELKSMQTKLSKLKTPLPKIYAASYGEDWKSQGDWLGSITNEWAILCAMNPPYDQNVYYGTPYYSALAFIGPNHKGSDALRYWLHWRRTDNRSSLMSVHYAFRRQSDWDDHGEAYPRTMDGPDVWIRFSIAHAGVFKLSLYFFNKDGHGGANRHRDYLVEIYNHPQERHLQGYYDPQWRDIARDVEKNAREQTPLVKTRIRDFWGGVHKQFEVTGPAIYMIKIKRNYSFNTIISGVMIQQIQGEPTMHVKQKDSYSELAGMRRISFEPPPIPETYKSDEGKTIAKLWNTTVEKIPMQNALEYRRKMQIAAYQASKKSAELGESEAKLALSLKRHLNQWDEEWKKELLEKVLQGWRNEFRANESLRATIKYNREHFPKIYHEPRFDESEYFINVPNPNSESE